MEDRQKKVFIKMLKGVNSFKDKMGIEHHRKTRELIAKIAVPTVKGLKFESFELCGMSTEWIINTGRRATRGVILYCHGGGYCLGDLNYARIISSKIALESGMDVLTFEYRLAPEHPYPSQLEDGVKAWDYIRSLGYEADDIIIMGESAGGHLALSIIQQLKLFHQELPKALVCISPWTDLSLSSDSIEKNKELDVAINCEFLGLCKDAFSKGHDLNDPFISPLYADFEGYPKTYIQAGTAEILYDDAKKLYENMRNAGVDCEFDDFEGMWHVFHMFPMKDSQRAIEKIGEFLESIVS